MPKTIGIACAEYEKCVVATTEGATRIHDRIGLVGRAIECTTHVRTLHAKAGRHSCARTKLETERKQSDAVATRHTVR